MAQFQLVQILQVVCVIQSVLPKPEITECNILFRHELTETCRTSKQDEPKFISQNTSNVPESEIIF